MGHQLNVVLNGGKKPHPFQRPVHRDFGHLDPHRRNQADFAGNALALPHQIIMRHHPANQANARGFVSVNRIPGQQQLLGPGQIHAEGRNQQRRPHAGPYLRLPHNRPLRGDFNVAHLHQFTSPGQSVPVHRRNHRLAQVPHPHKGIHIALQPPPPFIRLHLLRVNRSLLPLNIKAGRESPAGPGQNHCPNFRVILDSVQRLPKLPQQLPVQGVQPLRPVQRQVADSRPLFVKNGLESHTDGSA